MPVIQSLSINKNWKVIINEFYDIEPDKKNFDSDLKYYFMEDILEIKHIEKGALIHLGWYPEFNPDGAFKIVVFDTDYNGKLIEEFESKSKEEAVGGLVGLIKKYS